MIPTVQILLTLSAVALAYQVGRTERDYKRWQKEKEKKVKNLGDVEWWENKIKWWRRSAIASSLAAAGFVYPAYLMTAG